ncbi:Hsp90 cochaperone shq1 [Cichlidogyrus casuarinus]|uniref:Protein SHQ1 homolog n=1 Tax=Cichlidogyrus casuarinus TaxID=1844966 RepID=A0ABD2QKA0_9PLAT
MLFRADFEVVGPLFEAPWCKNDEEKPEFSKEAKYRMQVLSCKVLPCMDDIHSRKSVYFGCVDLLLAFTYDLLMREGDENPESGWNIAKLASSLSWLQNFHSIDQVLINFLRRLLCFPLYRNWKFGKIVVKQVSSLLLSKQGTKNMKQSARRSK